MTTHKFTFGEIEIVFTLTENSWRYSFEYKKVRYSNGMRNVIVQLTENQMKAMALKAARDAIKKDNERI